MDGSLFGTTSNGGANNSGTAFETDTNAAAITTLTSFAPAEGANPRARLTPRRGRKPLRDHARGWFVSGGCWCFGSRGCFADVPRSPARSHRFVCIRRLVLASPAGCGGGDFCPDGASLARSDGRALC